MTAEKQNRTSKSPMAAAVSVANWQISGRQKNQELDRFEDVLVSSTNLNFESERHNDGHHIVPTIHQAPTDICADILLGKVPKDQLVLKTDLVERLTSKYEWKPIRAILTAAGLYMTNPEEDSVRDLIPLCEVMNVLRMPDRDEQEVDNILAQSGAVRNLQFSSLLDGSAKRQHVLQLQTVEDGFNSGRTYYFATTSEAACRAWGEALRSAAEQAVLRMQAGPGSISLCRLRLCRSFLPPSLAPSPHAVGPPPSPAH
jgi:hypothetical protein